MDRPRTVGQTAETDPLAEPRPAGVASEHKAGNSSHHQPPSGCACGRTLLLALLLVAALGAFLFRQPIRCDQISATISAAVGPLSVASGQASALTEATPNVLPPTVPAPAPPPAFLAPAPAKPLEAPVPFVMRSKDPCVPVLGQKVVVGPREEFEYVQSAMEKEWFQEPRMGQICKLALQQKQQAAMWLNYSKAVFKPVVDQPPRDPTPQEAEVLSYFLDKDQRRHWIEPLSGVARNPHSVCPNTGGVDKFDIQYLVLETYCGHPGPKPRVKLFDMGCTTNWNWKLPKYDFYNVDYRRGVGLGPSIPLFFNMYRDRCMEFDDIFGWEAKGMNPNEWWSPLPDNIRERTRFYNIPVNETSCQMSTKGLFAERGSFLHMLPYAAKPEDFVVVKLDIDGGPELAIMEALIRFPELSSLVDEIFFEYHFWFDGGNFGWGQVDKAWAVLLVVFLFFFFFLRCCLGLRVSLLGFVV
ncbi:unnamed protein product [Symbiodinium natans]|uniref:Methyltransferase FkbM domain-containing protein n=1 Tax=Symbiodinium natans TaxID=878477 RepID=A0A812T4H0_9DINO|nr:unnamed protein product [Symbiodinium natans]